MSISPSTLQESSENFPLPFLPAKTPRDMAQNAAYSFSSFVVGSSAASVIPQFLISPIAAAASRRNPFSIAAQFVISSPDWTPIGTNLALDGLAFWIDTDVTNYVRRFYRARLP